jgi:hypothetical protein
MVVSRQFRHGDDDGGGLHLCPGISCVSGALESCIYPRGSDWSTL